MSVLQKLLFVSIFGVIFTGCSSDQTTTDLNEQFVKTEIAQLLDTDEYLTVYPPSGNLEHTFEPTPEFTGVLGSGFVSATGEVRSTCIEEPKVSKVNTPDGLSLIHI